MIEVTVSNSKIQKNDRVHHIDNFSDLAANLGIPPKILSYVRKFKTEHNMQTLVRVKDRNTYKSSRQLSLIQKKIKDLTCQKIFDSIDSTGHILAYKKGFDYRKILQDCVNNSLQVSYDIKKCYDNITYKHIVDMLQNYGYSFRGAKLIAGYCTVKRTLRSGKSISTLQQGSQCSPIISNLVFNLFLDEPIIAWINNYIKQNKSNFTYKYYRYSDNVVLFLQGTSIPLDFLKEYKEKYRELLNAKGVFVHDEYTTANNHPHRNQRFLGIVLNKVARIDKREFNKIRAILFNFCVKGIAQESRKYIEEKLYAQTGNPEMPYTEEDIIQVVKSIFTGKMSYIKSINAKQYVQLKNLLSAAIKLGTNKEIAYQYSSEGFSRLKDTLFNFIKRNYTLQEDPFTEGIDALITQLKQDNLDYSNIQI